MSPSPISPLRGVGFLATPRTAFTPNSVGNSSVAQVEPSNQPVEPTNTALATSHGGAWPLENGASTQMRVPGTSNVVHGPSGQALTEPQRQMILLEQHNMKTMHLASEISHLPLDQQARMLQQGNMLDPQASTPGISPQGLNGPEHYAYIRPVLTTYVWEQDPSKTFCTARKESNRPSDGILGQQTLEPSMSPPGKRVRPAEMDHRLAFRRAQTKPIAETSRDPSSLQPAQIGLFNPPSIYQVNNPGAQSHGSEPVVFSDVAIFVDRFMTMWASGAYTSEQICRVLPNCLRGSALGWYHVQLDAAEKQRLLCCELSEWQERLSQRFAPPTLIAQLALYEMRYTKTMAGHLQHLPMGVYIMCALRHARNANISESLALGVAWDGIFEELRYFYAQPKEGQSADDYIQACDLQEAELQRCSHEY